MTSITTSTGLRVRLHVDRTGRTQVHATTKDGARLYRVGEVIPTGLGPTFKQNSLSLALSPEVLRAIATLIDGSTE